MRVICLALSRILVSSTRLRDPLSTISRTDGRSSYSRGIQRALLMQQYGFMAAPTVSLAAIDDLP